MDETPLAIRYPLEAVNENHEHGYGNEYRYQYYARDFHPNWHYSFELWIVRIPTWHYSWEMWRKSGCELEWSGMAYYSGIFDNLTECYMSTHRVHQVMSDHMWRLRIFSGMWIA